MQKLISFPFLLGLIHLCTCTYGQTFTIEQISRFPFPSELVSSPTQQEIAWVFQEEGRRNIYLASAPGFSPFKLTDFDEDDGQEISSLQFSADGEWLVFVRGGEHGGRNAHTPVNPQNLPQMPKVSIMKISMHGGKAIELAEGDYPIVSSSGKVAYLKNGQVWQTTLYEAKSEQLFQVKGNVNGLQWSSDGSMLLFVANRSDHAFVGVFRDGQSPIQWLSPSFHKDTSPRWSPDGKRVVFVRLPGGTGEAKPILEQRHSPWEIWIADLETGQANRRWKAPETVRGSVPTTDGGFNLHWAAEDELIYLSYEDGWPHLYAMKASGSASRLLTPGEFMVEHVRLSPDGLKLYFSANAGEDPSDLDRRHIGTVNIADGNMELITDGKGIEAIPAPMLDGRHVAYLSATATRPLLPTVMDIMTKNKTLIGQKNVPEDFPSSELVVPTAVQFKAADGTTVYGQVFEKDIEMSNKPAVLFIHGGPQRQMLLGWSYMDYYANTYAINQYLAGRGFVVLSVNYRLGIGYGHDFHKAERTWTKGGEEYLDVKAAGAYLADLPQVDPDKIGVYGGSYGGYLTAMALARDSDLFKVGVDIHGVHNLDGRLGVDGAYEQAPDIEEARKVAWFSSPVAYLDGWTSPVLLIHATDDRNVDFRQSSDFARRLDEKGIPYESLVIPDDTHHWMKFSNLIKVHQATCEFLERHLLGSE
ncbi:S9 family peptidase [Pararhodonellum marinum]|uniref:S9 family peptidase n=1 Tax=Pararhodonellum marinum TaxID=2755358 RepID=UPI00188E10B5|nr:prolyl oligopeptidase family serine peptidase [Pararhodonellum marinum]